MALVCGTLAMRQSRQMTEELAPSEVAKRLGTSTRTVQRWIERGVLPARRVGGRWRVAFDAFDALSTQPTERADAARPIRRLFIANRGEIARAHRAHLRPARDPTRSSPTPTARTPLDLLDVGRGRGRGSRQRRRRGPSGLRVPCRERRLRRGASIAAGLRWVGPPPTAIRAMGDKAAARRLAASLDVPVLAGYDGADQTDAALTPRAARSATRSSSSRRQAAAARACARSASPSAFRDALAAARREAPAAFGDDRLILERLLEGARHVEVQVLFDAAGNGVHLGERDCSIQRRHQKVLEETPSPAIDATLRARLGDAALALARAVGYVNAGTCEFLIDARGEPTFLEMNTRLQVEHPVTELVTGRDLVADQLRIAAGEPLGFGQGDVPATGHAIEVRLYAEDAEDGFLPATGRVEAPSLAGRRRHPGRRRDRARAPRSAAGSTRCSRRSSRGAPIVTKR